MSYKEKIVDTETGEETWRDYSAAEIKAVQKAEAEAAARIVELREKEAARKAILEKLGISEDEAAVLLG